MIRAVLFDMDGTLVDTERIYRACWRQAMDELGIVIDTERFFVNVSGMNIPTIRAFCEKEYGTEFPFEQLRQRRRSLMNERIERDGAPRKRGVPDIFPVLKRMGVKIAVASSSGIAWVPKVLRSAGIDVGVFDCLMTGDNVEHGKPDPEIFLKTAAALEVAPRECVVAEDSANGVRAGYAAGMRTVMIPDLQPCTETLRGLLWHCIDSLEILPSLIEKFNLEGENT